MDYKKEWNTLPFQWKVTFGLVGLYFVTEIFSVLPTLFTTIYNIGYDFGSSIANMILSFF